MMTNINTDYENAKQEFLSGNANPKFFIKNGYELEAAYCYLVLDDLKKAEEMFQKIEDKDIRAHWGLVMLGLINGAAGKYPTYFELRNFLEIDLNILINYYKGDYVEKIIRNAAYMFTINPEVYKYIGRAFINNDLEEQGVFILNIAKNNFYNDPELHYMLAEIYYGKKDYEKCKKSLETCLNILPGYAPALKKYRHMTDTII